MIYNQKSINFKKELVKREKIVMEGGCRSIPTDLIVKVVDTLISRQPQIYLFGIIGVGTQGAVFVGNMVTDGDEPREVAVKMAEDIWIDNEFKKTKPLKSIPYVCSFIDAFSFVGEDTRTWGILVMPKIDHILRKMFSAGNVQEQLFLQNMERLF